MNEATATADCRFTVVLATRDRPQLFDQALQSVLDQQGADVEVVVVNDGSAPHQVAAYQPVWDRAASRLGDRFRVFHLVHRPKGHGQSYSLNFGVAQARGEFVCFLDDDDYWTDTGHLARASAAIDRAAANGRPLDLFMANQEAWTVSGKRVGVLWLGGLADDLRSRGTAADPAGNFEVGVPDLMAASGFCHLNCLTVRRSLFAQVGGMDEGIRWECDRDIFLKLVEAAQVLVHCPAVMSYHRVPDPTLANNMTTALPMADKRLLQCIVLDRAILRTRHPAILGHATQHKGYALKKLAREFAERRDWVRAAHYAWQALGADPGVKWLAYALGCQVRRWAS